MKAKIRSKVGIYIGDPCYVLGGEDYDRACCREGLFVTKRGCFFTDKTYYGDGSYEGSDGVEYYVDSGTLGVIAGELIDGEMDDVTKEHSHYFECTDDYIEALVKCEDGVFYILITQPSKPYVMEYTVRIDTRWLIDE